MVHVVDIAIAKSGPNLAVVRILTSKLASRHSGELMWWFSFYSKMCFWQQWRALFGHLNFQTYSEPKLPLLTSLLSNFVSCPNGAQSLISHPTRWLWSHKTLGNKAVFRFFYPFAGFPLLSSGSVHIVAISTSKFQ